MPVNTGFYWSLWKIFNEIFNDFSSRSLSGTGTSRTRPLPGCETKSAAISLQNESAGYTLLNSFGVRFCARFCLFRPNLLQENRPFFCEKAEMSAPARGDGDFLFCRVGVKLGN